MKIAPLALSAAVLIGLSACSGSATESSPDTMDQATATPEDRHPQSHRGARGGGAGDHRDST